MRGRKAIEGGKLLIFNIGDCRASQTLKHDDMPDEYADPPAWAPYVMLQCLRKQLFLRIAACGNEPPPCCLTQQTRLCSLTR